MKILIVDDNRDERRVLRYMVEKNGHEAIEAEDGSDGLQKAKSTEPDLIISDVLMPVLDGFQFLREVKQDPVLRSIPFIFYSSSYKEDQDVRLAISLGADTYVIKPLEPAKLWGKVEALLKAGKTEKTPLVPLIKEDAEYLKQYSQVVAAKLEKKVHELERTLAERDQAEAALEKSGERYRRIVDTANEGIWVLGEDLLTTFVNPKMARLLGYGTGEMTGRQLTDFMFDEDIPDHYRRMESRQKGLLENYERRFRCRDGKTVWTMVSAVPIMDGGQNFKGAFGMFTDITERKAAEEELRILSSAIEQSPVSIVITDTKGSIEFVNPKFTLITGYSFEEAQGKNPRIMKSGTTPREEYRRLWATITAGKVWKGTFCNRKKNGELFWEEAIIAPVRNTAGVTTHYIAIKEDITEKRKLEDQLRQAQKMEAIGTLASGVAHDFNNILQVIIGYGHIIKARMRPDDPQRAAIDQVLASSVRATHLTQGLLAFSRKQVIRPRPLDVNGAVKSIEKLLRRLIGEDVELAVRITDRSLIVMADAGQIEQVLMNLATNARDAMPEGGLLSIATEKVDMREDFISAHGFGKPGRYALITVSDTGAGMDAETREKIFDPFFTTKELGKGTGLGLSIVYGIIKQHDGNINVYSELGKGTSFKMYLPLISTAVEEATSEEVAPPVGGTETILLAEDDADVRKLHATLLREFGYRVLDAVDGQDALEQFQAHAKEFDLLVLDVIMPKNSGKDLSDAAKAVRPDVPVLFISGYNTDVIHKKGVFEEGAEFISKPASPFELLRKIRKIIDAQYGKRS